MPADSYIRPTRSVPPPVNPLLIPTPPAAPLIPPVHVVDLMTLEGSAAFGARWKVREAKVIEVPALSDAMPQYRSTYDIEPHAEVAGFDDREWEEIAPVELAAKRGGGLVSFFWFRALLTMPDEAQGFATAGAKAVLRVNIDDYAEIWVNGELPRAAGRPSPACIQGFNMPNRLVLGGDTVQPGERFEVAVFAINGPLSAGPANFLWFREAKVEFFR